MDEGGVKDEGRVGEVGVREGEDRGWNRVR